MLAKSLVSCVFVMVACHRGKREGRLFSFNFEERDIVVDLDFSIPFLSIPIKKTVNSYGISELPTVNINPASLALGGAVVLGTTILMPLLMKNYMSTTGYRYSRLLENTEFGADTVIDFANQMLSDANGLRGCTLRIACWTAQKHDADMTRIVHHVAKNKLLSTFINSTAIEDAMLSGRNGRDCNTYKPCPVQEHYVPILMNNLAEISKSYGLK